MDVFKQKWQEIKNKVKQKWNKLTDEDIHQINGKREQLISKLHSKYGWEQRHVEEELKRFESSLEGERGQKIRPEFNREEDSRKSGNSRSEYSSGESFRKGEKNRSELQSGSDNKKTQKFKKEHFDRLEEDKSDEDQDFPKRKVR